MIRPSRIRPSTTARTGLGLLGLAAALWLPACSSSGAAIAGAAAAPAQACAAGAPALEDLRLRPGDDAQARASLLLSAADRLKLVDVSRLDGACARALQGFRMAELYLADAVTLQLRADGQPQPAQAAAAGYRERVAIGAGDAHPEAPSGQFLMAARVQAAAAGSPAGDFVGLWHDRGAWKLYAFSRDAAGRFGTPAHLLDSRLPLRSVSYFPAPDSPGGRLGLVQDAPGEMRLISLDWFHPRPPR